MGPMPPFQFKVLNIIKNKGLYFTNGVSKYSERSRLHYREKKIGNFHFITIFSSVKNRNFFDFFKHKLNSLFYILNLKILNNYFDNNILWNLVLSESPKHHKFLFDICFYNWLFNIALYFRYFSILLHFGKNLFVWRLTHN